MKFLICLFVLNAYCVHAISQDIQPFALETCSDSSVYPSFAFIMPEKNTLQIKLPAIPLKQYTLSRSLMLKSLGITIPVLVGATPSDGKVIVIDENMNNDLTDDQPIYFTDTLNGPGKGNYKHAKISIPADSHRKGILVEFDYSIIKPPALKLDLGDSLENNFFLFVRSNQYRKTVLSMQDSSYTFLLLTDKLFNFERGATHLIVSTDTGVIHNFKKQPYKYNKYASGDILLAGSQKYVFKGVSPLGDTLFLKPLSSDTLVYGNKTGFRINKFSAQDLITKTPITNDSYPGKYILLDFWGTWCGPCLSILNDIRKLHDSADPRKIKIISVCYDDNKEKVISFLKKNEIDWPQIFDSKDSSVFATLFGINAYPSFILIDPQGKVVYRDESTNGFYRVKDKITRILAANR